MTDSDEKKNGTDGANDKFPGEGSTTEHGLALPSGSLSFRAIADWVTLRKIHKPIAHMFHTAYLVDGANDRPLTFIFNGGPGAASAYLHMGALGPQRVAFGEMGRVPAPPTRVVDNLETWLAFSDLVFIDPVGTGFSRALKDEKKAKPDAAKEDKDDDDPQENVEFWGIERDLDSLGEFIRRFLSAHHRWTSPLFIAGESYGGFRVAKMARKLQETHGVGLCGAMLISPAVEFDSLFGSDYNLTHWVELFPSLAASAHHHGLTRNAPQAAAAVLELAESFAQNELSRWLVQGDVLPADERVATVGRMSELCGLAPSFIERAGGRITSTMFCRELLRDQRRLCGHYDGAVTTVDPFPDRNNYEGPDPTLFSIDRLFSAGINHHLRANLKLESDLDYRLLSMHVNRSWKDDSQGKHAFRQLVGAMDDLRYGMSLNEHMKVFISHGRFDMVTPYYSSKRLIDLMKLTDEQRANLTNRHYDGGHMFYSWDTSRKEFHADTKQFYESALTV